MSFPPELSRWWKLHARAGRQGGRLEEAETEYRGTLTSQNSLALVLRDLGLPENLALSAGHARDL